MDTDAEHAPKACKRILTEARAAFTASTDSSARLLIYIDSLAPLVRATTTPAVCRWLRQLADGTPLCLRTVSCDDVRH